MRTFTIANERTLVDRIDRSVERVVFIAPGLFENVADALISKIAGDGLSVLKVVVDADENACRLGFGDIKAVRKLKNAAEQYGFMLCQQPGLRVGLLLTDNDLLVWSPAPLLVEEQSDSDSRPNAVEIYDGNLDNLVKAIGVTSSEADILHQEIGLDPLPEDQLKRAEESLDKNPPKAFDLARKERVFSSILEFVEMTLTQYKMSKKVLSVPAELVALFRDKSLERRWRNQYTIFEGHECKVQLMYGGHVCEVDETFLDEERKRLDAEYLVSIPGYGKVMALRQKSDFEREIEAFKVLLEAYAKGIEKRVLQYIEKMVDQLAIELSPRFLQNPPKNFKKTILIDIPQEEHAVAYIRERLMSETRVIAKQITPKLSVVYKGITYETFKNKDFEEKLNASFGSGAVQHILREHDAAPEAVIGERCIGLL